METLHSMIEVLTSLEKFLNMLNGKDNVYSLSVQ